MTYKKVRNRLAYRYDRDLYELDDRNLASTSEELEYDAYIDFSGRVSERVARGFSRRDVMTRQGEVVHRAGRTVFCSRALDLFARSAATLEERPSDRPTTMYERFIHRFTAVLGSLMLVVVAAGCESGNATMEEQAAINELSEAEREAGWELLFDGSTFEGWRGLGRDHIPEGHWRIEDGAIRKVASGAVPTAPDGQPLEGGDILTEEAFEDFELVLEWRVGEAGNSGIKYNVSEAMSTSYPPEHAALGFEYQVLDDDRHPDALNGPTRTAGALYDMIPAGEGKRLKPVGEWNRARIVFDGSRGEHWLNDELIVEYDMESARFDSLLAASKYADVEGFAVRRTGHIVLQDHGDDVWFRNIKIRRL